MSATQHDRSIAAEILRRRVMDLIANEIHLWNDDDPPRHAIATLWGKVRDMDLEEITT